MAIPLELVFTKTEGGMRMNFLPVGGLLVPRPKTRRPNGLAELLIRAAHGLVRALQRVN